MAKPNKRTRQEGAGGKRSDSAAPVLPDVEIRDPLFQNHPLAKREPELDPAVPLDIAEAMRLLEGCKSTKLLDQIEKWLKERQSEEEDRRRLIEGKATTLLAAVGVSASVTSGLGLTALPALIKAGLPPSAAVGLGMMVIVMAGIGTAAAMQSGRVLLVSSAHVASDKAVIDRATLLYFADETKKDEEPLGYRIIRCRDLLRLLHETQPRVNLKAERLSVAQKLFLAFVGSIFMTINAFIVATIW